MVMVVLRLAWFWKNIVWRLLLLYLLIVLKTFEAICSWFQQKCLFFLGFLYALHCDLQLSRNDSRHQFGIKINK